ncbi:Uncharacterized protein PECH_005110 [Penicillium ucsense]|uniref:Uncharacterized protein n=1 Tax=Penicillium ucsense TaxID=2839758 RepID=A0A8J8WK15_9EURO|nr:Uncharacterized protein PECM_005914 [Penicillium ucsense]KAF7736603.1 Uncharacterized protein PECH_005110 [Penicillium ucsense]
MDPSIESPADIPPFAKPLAPYIKSRQEALHIRQALTSYLCSFIVCGEGTALSTVSHGFLPQCTPSEAVTDVKRIPADLSGLRKDYLKALQANVAARKELTRTFEDIAALRCQTASPKSSVQSGDRPDSAAGLQDYLQLLRDRRRYTKLQTFQHYLDELKAKDMGIPRNLEEREQPSALSDPLSPYKDDSGTSVAGRAEEGDKISLEELVHQLERAVVRARSQLDTEKHLFDKIKSQQTSGNDGATGAAAPQVKSMALQRTRDELVQWVEQRLLNEGDPDASLIQGLAPEDLEEVNELLGDQKSRINEQYTAYLEARQDLLDAASRACQPVTVTRERPLRTAPRSETVSASTPGPDPLEVLSLTTDALLPLSKSQRALALQRSYMAGLLAKERSSTLCVLHRLCDESHLLPEYPMPAKPSRSKFASGPLASGLVSQPVDTTPSDEVVEMAKAWSFASGAASQQERDYVQQRLTLGNEVARDARKLLRDVYSMLKQDWEQGPHEDDNSKGISRESVRGLCGTAHHDGSHGPWSGLDGSV